MTLMRSPLPSLVAARFVDRGLDPEPHLKAFGLQRALIEPTVLAEVDVLAAFYDDAAQRLGQPHLGLDLVDTISRGAYGLPEFGIRAAPTVREALRRLARFAVLLNEATPVDVLESEEGRVRVHQRIPGYPIAGGRHSNEYFIGVLLEGGRAMTQDGLFAQRVWFCHPAPEDLTRHRAVFGDAVLSFDCPDNGLEIPRSIADMSLQSADPPLMRAIDSQADAMLAERSTEHEFLGRVREGIGRTLRDGTPTLQSVAEQIAMTPRTLQRRLSAHDTTFREVLDGLRAELHKRLQAQGMSPQERAFRLGYTDMGAFRRALRRWKG